MIEPQPPGRHVFSRLKLPRLGAVLLATLARNLGWSAQVYVEDIAPIDYQDALTADLVGISTITSTAPRAYAIADSLREFGVPVVMGGPHVSFCEEEALAHADWVVRGEGEKPFIALLDALKEEGDMEAVPSLSYRGQDGQLRHNPPAEPLEDLDSLPHPDFTLISGWQAARSFYNLPMIPIQMTRGCPYNCRFCSVVRMFGRKLRRRSADHIMEELSQYREQMISAFVYDDNFTADRAWAKQILSRMVDEKICPQNWSAQVRVDAARDPELLELMRAAGCKTVCIGFESANPESLKEMKKGQTLEEMVLAVREFKQASLDVHGMFIFGFDHDTKESLRETVRFAKRLRILSAQFLQLTPLPGTPTYDELKNQGRLIIHDWAQYDGGHVTFTPSNLSRRELQLEQIRAHAVFYSHGRALKQLLGGYVTGSLIYLYARKLNREWVKGNRVYLKALELSEKARHFNVSFDFELDLSEVREQIAQAAMRLVYAWQPNKELPVT